MKIASRPLGITVIASVNASATVIALAFWFLVQQRLFQSNLSVTLDRASVASTLGFMIADLIWAVPLLPLSVPGLLHLRNWGWTAAQMANILWIYPLTAGLDS